MFHDLHSFRTRTWTRKTSGPVRAVHPVERLTDDDQDKSFGGGALHAHIGHWQRPYIHNVDANVPKFAPGYPLRGCCGVNCSVLTHER